MSLRCNGSGMTWILMGVVLWLAAGSAPAAALEPGEVCPDFDLPWLDGGGRARAAEVLPRAPITVLLFWNRECPHCADLALSVDYLAEAVAGDDAQVVPIAFGPDDPVSLRFLLRDEGVRTRQLWDAEGSVAAAYDLGFEHLGIFVVSADRRLAAVFHSEISDLLGDVVPAVREAAQALPADAGLSAERGGGAAIGAAGPRLRTDGRLRFLTTEGTEPGDLGLYGERLESGALLLLRWDLRLVWDLAPGVTFVPWLRVSNEDEVLLTEGPEQFASRYGTASLKVERGRVAATLGAFPLRISPLLLQRWDEEDAPPLGGVSGCSTCGAGASGLSQRSLEVLGPDYRFEGASARWTGDYTAFRVWAAVARRENALPRDSGVSARDSLDARYRRVLHGATMDIGWAGRKDPVFGLPEPFGLRVGYLSVGDDARTVGSEYIRPSEDRDEQGVSVLAVAGPWRGLSVDGEHVWWHLTHRAAARVWDSGWVTRWSRAELDRRAVRGGIRGRWSLGRGALWARVHRIWAEPGFDPLYAALTYEGNRRGWRGAIGFDRDANPGSGPRFLGAGVFYRATEESEATSSWGEPIQETIGSVTLRGRPCARAEGQLHGVRTTTEYPAGVLPDEETLGLSLDLRWPEWPTVDPMVRVDAIRRDSGVTEPHWVWQAAVSVRVLP
jgi:peroxiredoxin